MTDAEFRDLVERAHQIKELTEQPAWTLLVDYIHAQLEPKQRAILGGVHEDLLRYKHETGWIQGALAVLNAADRLADQLERAQQERAEAEATVL